MGILDESFDLVYVLRHDASSVNVQDNSGKTPLLLAASNSNLHIMQLLLQHGADMSILTLSNWAPLHAAVMSGNAAAFMRYDHPFSLFSALCNGGTRTRRAVFYHRRLHYPYLRH